MKGGSMLKHKDLLGPILIIFSSLAYADQPLYNCNDLQYGISLNLKENFYLANDIYCDDNVFYPIEGEFSGTLDGRGFTIYDLHLQNHASEPNRGNVGLFRTLSGSNADTEVPAVKNIKFENVTIKTHAEIDRGVIAGKAENAELSDITMNTLKIVSTSSDNVEIEKGVSGGLIGQAINISLSNVHLSNVSIDKNTYVGGLLGVAIGNTVIKQSSINTLSTPKASCGYHYIRDNNQTHPVAFDTYECGFGGLIGRAGDDATHEGMIKITSSSAQGKSDIHNHAGGLIGRVQPGQAVSIDNSYSNVILEPKDCREDCEYAGGALGRAEGTNIKDAKPITLNYVFVLGRVKLDAEYRARAVVGHKEKHGAKRVSGSENYFDLDTVEKNHSGDDFSIGVNTVALQDPNNKIFENWDASIWKFEKGKYPELVSNISE